MRAPTWGAVLKACGGGGGGGGGVCRQPDAFVMAWAWHRAVVELCKPDTLEPVYAPVEDLPLAAEGRHMARLRPASEAAVAGGEGAGGAVSTLARYALQAAADPAVASPEAVMALAAAGPEVVEVPRLVLCSAASRTEPSLVVHVCWVDGVKEVHLESPTVIHNRLHTTALRVVVTGIGRPATVWEHVLGKPLGGARRGQVASHAR